MTVIQYKCPNCGGPLKFDPATGKHTCEYCKSAFVSESLNTGNAAQAVNADEGGRNAENRDSSIEDSRVYTCPSCGATIVTDATTAATFCYYCHNPVVLEGRLDGADKPDYVVPFKVSKEKALEIFGQWIAKKKYVPKAFYSESQIEKFTGVYFPYYIYTCNIDGSIDGEATKVSVYERGQYEYTETGIYHVTRAGNMEVKHVLRNALKKANSVLAEAVIPFYMDGDNLKPFNMSYLSGFFAEKKDMMKESLESEVRQEVKNYAVSKLRESVADYQDIQVTEDNTELKNEKWEYALLPVWSLTYNSNGKIYYFSINGQTGKPIGELPVDTGKLISTFLLIFIPIALALFAVFYFIL